MPRWAVEKKSPRYRLDGMTDETIECENYKEYRAKYLSKTDRVDKIQWNRIATNTDREQFSRYSKVLGKNAPKSLEDFCKIKYNNSGDYDFLQLKYKNANLQHKIKTAYNLNIEEGKQGKHIKGHNNYNKGKSYLTITMENAQKLVNKYAGSGVLERDRKGKWKHTEIITSNDKAIGYVISIIDGQEIETSSFKIHYGKNGTHIVPHIRKVK